MNGKYYSATKILAIVTFLLIFAGVSGCGQISKSNEKRFILEQPKSSEEKDIKKQESVKEYLLIKSKLIENNAGYEYELMKDKSKEEIIPDQQVGITYNRDSGEFEQESMHVVSNKPTLIYVSKSKSIRSRIDDSENFQFIRLDEKIKGELAESIIRDLNIPRSVIISDLSGGVLFSPKLSEYDTKKDKVFNFAVWRYITIKSYYYKVRRSSILIKSVDDGSSFQNRFEKYLDDKCLYVRIDVAKKNDVMWDVRYRNIRGKFLKNKMTGRS